MNLSGSYLQEVPLLKEKLEWLWIDVVLKNLLKFMESLHS